MPTSATSENQAMLACPRGSTMKAASSGPIAEPTLPPTWNTDCARPCRPPEARRATREDFGVEHRRADADQRRGQQQHADSSAPRQQQQPDEREAHADGERVRRRLAVGEEPTSGCSSEAVTWNVRVMSPIWPKSSAKVLLSIG